jgi:hypothetical protein
MHCLGPANKKLISIWKHREVIEKSQTADGREIVREKKMEQKI